MPVLQARDEKSSKLEDFWNAKTEAVRNKLDRHGAGDTSWIENIAECPVYYPTKQDFMQDPLHYIQKIAAEASKYGMCKIVSPVVASVPAGMVLSKEQSGFKFTTRVQPMRLSNWDKDDKITFPMSGRNYTLTEYEKMANRVFSRKFSTAGNLPPRFIESEFWKELAVGKSRTVEYATDVEGSAFSSSSTDPLGQSKWNLKGISRLPYSTLRLLEDAIPGVTEPMLYIGMLFSMFSWHIEDHYLYSINYQHCGAPKTWYGVPGDAALCFEKVARDHVYDTELLRDTGKGAELDLLLEKTTLFTPKLLAEHGVPVFKAVQYPGEFIITFPRAYHAGFSNGFNCGEAVNFAMADWFSLGAEACSRYAFLNRFPLLPHEKLLCKEAGIVSQINQTGHDNPFCELQAHVKVAFVAWMRSLLQIMSSLKLHGAKVTTSNETSVFCGLCKHMCHVAYTSCKCFSEPTCFNHGSFFRRCTCESERMIVLKDDFAYLEAVAQKFESEVEIRNRVQKLSLEREDGSKVAEDIQFEKSSSIHAKDSGECCKTQGDKENAYNGGTIAQVGSCDGATSSDCRQGQEEEESDTEVVQFKRRKVSLPQSKRFQVDEQEISPEKSTILIQKKSECQKVESSCSSDTTNEPFDRSSDSEMLRKRKNLEGSLVKANGKQLTATMKDSLLPAEFDLDCDAKQVAESKHVDSRNSSKSMGDSTLSFDEGVPMIKEGQDQKVSGLYEIVPELEEEQTPCIESRNEDGVLKQGRSDAGLMKAEEDYMEHSSSEAMQIDIDPQAQTTKCLADETNLIEDLTILNSRNVVSSSTEEAETEENVNGRKVDDANGANDACDTAPAPKGASADEGRPCHTEGDYPSSEFRCETDPLAPKNVNFLLGSPAGEQPLVDLVERNSVSISAVKTEPLKDSGKLETANISTKKGLVIHLNRKVEQIHKKKFAEIIYDEEKSSICENLMEQVDIFEGQSGGIAWCLDQEVVSSYSDQNDGKWFSPSQPSTSICSVDLKYAKAEENLYLKTGSLLEMEQLIVGQQETGNIVGLPHDNKLPLDDFGHEVSKRSSHYESNDCVKGRIGEGESSSTQYSFVMPSLVPGSSSFTIEGEHKFGVLENLDALSCGRNVIPPADCCDWQKSEISSQGTSEVNRGLSSAGVCVPRDDYRWDTRLDAHSSGLDSSNLHQSEGYASNFVDKRSYQAQNFVGVKCEPHVNWSHHRLQGHADFSSRHSTTAMSNNSHRFGPSYKPRPSHRNYHPFQTDNIRSMKYPRVFQKKENMPYGRWDRRPKRHYSRGWRGGALENNKSSSGGDNPGVKGVFDAGFAGSTSAGSVHVEGYDPMKWEISPVANPRQFSSTSHYVPSVWAERRP